MFEIILAILLLGAAINIMLIWHKERTIIKNGCCGQKWAAFDVDSRVGCGLRCKCCGTIKWVLLPCKPYITKYTVRR